MTNLPEAPASLNFIMDLQTKQVKNIQVTLRGFDETEVVARARALMSELGVGSPPEPEPVPKQPETWEEVGKDVIKVVEELAEEEAEILEKPTAEVEFSKTGIRYLRVRGGRWMKYGVCAWPEVVPFEGWENWETGQVYNLPMDAVVSMKEYNGKMVPDKVIRFK